MRLSNSAGPVTQPVMQTVLGYPHLTGTTASDAAQTDKDDPLYSAIVAFQERLRRTPIDQIIDRVVKSYYERPDRGDRRE